MKLQERISLATGACVALAAAAGAAISFGPASSIPAGANPSGIATGDFNNDGLTDYAVTVDGPDRVVVFNGDGAGGFTAGQTVLLGANAGAGDMAAADFDGNGQMDLAICLQNQASVRIVAQTGGVLALGATVPVGANPRGISARDHNGDGRVDFVVANRDANSASVGTNGVAGWTVSTFAVGAEPRAATFVNVDGDTDFDVATSNHDDETVTIATNNLGTFAAAATLSAGIINRPEGITSADFNGDGVADIAAATGNTVVVFLRSGTGFAGGVNFPAGGVNAGHIIAADFDADGSMDIATANEDSNNLSVLPGSGNGTFGAAVVVASGANPQQIAAGDLNGDGCLDLASANRDSGDVSIAMNTGCDEPPPPPPACQADIDGDGDVDSTDLNILLSTFGCQA